MKQTVKLAAALAATLSLSAGAALADNPVVLKAVGTWSSLTNYQKHEGPFFNERLAEASGGSIVGEIQSQSGLGLKGFEIMRLVKNGVFDFAFGLPGYVAAENAIFEGADLSSVTQDINTQRQVAEAYYPTMEKAFAEIYNAKLLMLYPFPSQTLWCNAEVNGIEDLKGKKIRVYATTLGDFVEGAGGTSVTVPFSEVIPALEKGVVDCGITGTASGNIAKLPEVTSYVYALNAGWAPQLRIVNAKWFAKQPAEVQEWLTLASAYFEQEMAWPTQIHNHEMGLACTAGEARCDTTGGFTMYDSTVTYPTEAELKTVQEQVQSDVLPNIAANCGDACVADWNETVGKVVGITMSK